MDYSRMALRGAPVRDLSLGWIWRADCHFRSDHHGGILACIPALCEAFGACLRYRVGRVTRSVGVGTNLECSSTDLLVPFRKRLSKVAGGLSSSTCEAFHLVAGAVDAALGQHARRLCCRDSNSFCFYRGNRVEFAHAAEAARESLASSSHSHLRFGRLPRRHQSESERTADLHISATDANVTGNDEIY